MQFAFVIFTIVAGALSTIESGSNNTLQKGLQAPWWTMVFVAAITLVSALVAMLIVREPLPDAQTMRAVPWYGWLGGLLALLFVASTVFASPRLGAGLFVALIVTASTVSSLVLDHYGLMQFPVREASWGRIAGALLMVAGVALIGRF